MEGVQPRSNVRARQGGLTRLNRRRQHRQHRRQPEAFGEPFDQPDHGNGVAGPAVHCRRHGAGQQGLRCLPTPVRGLQPVIEFRRAQGLSRAKGGEPTHAHVEQLVEPGARLPQGAHGRTPVLAGALHQLGASLRSLSACGCWTSIARNTGARAEGAHVHSKSQAGEPCPPAMRSLIRRFIRCAPSSSSARGQGRSRRSSRTRASLSRQNARIPPHRSRQSPSLRVPFNSGADARPMPSDGAPFGRQDLRRARMRRLAIGLWRGHRQRPSMATERRVPTVW